LKALPNLVKHTREGFKSKKKERKAIRFGRRRSIKHQQALFETSQQRFTRPLSHHEILKG